MVTEAGGPSIMAAGLRRAETILLPTLIVIMGMFLTYFTGSLSPPDGIVNPVWGSVFGFGFWVENELFAPLPSGLLGLLLGIGGALIWPAFVVIAFLRIIRLVRYVDSKLCYYLFYFLLLVSVIYNLPVSQVYGSWATDMPIFIKYLDF